MPNKFLYNMAAKENMFEVESIEFIISPNGEKRVYHNAGTIYEEMLGKIYNKDGYQAAKQYVHDTVIAFYIKCQPK